MLALSLINGLTLGRSICWLSINMSSFAKHDTSWPYLLPRIKEMMVKRPCKGPLGHMGKRHSAMITLFTVCATLPSALISVLGKVSFIGTNFPLASMLATVFI